MIICICRGVSDHQVRKAVDEGKICLRQLRSSGVGDCCGACVETLNALIAESAISRHSEPSCDGCMEMPA